MKKIIFTIITLLFTITLITKPAHAYESPFPTNYIVLTSYGSFVRPGGLSEYEEHELIYYSTSLLGYNTNNLIELYNYSVNNDVDVIIMMTPLNEIVGHSLLVDGIYIQSPTVKYAYAVISFSEETVYIYNQTNQLIISQQLYNYSTISIEYTIQVYDYQGRSEAYNQGYNQGYANGQMDGYDTARNEYGKYLNGQYITADNYGQIRYTNGYDEAQTYYAYNSNGVYLTATEYAQIRFNEGYEIGLTSEIDWFNWAFTFITMPVRILNVEVLPNIKIGYFALFTLMTGIISWFFFIVGKGRGKK